MQEDLDMLTILIVLLFDISDPLSQDFFVYTLPRHYQGGHGVVAPKFINARNAFKKREWYDIFKIKSSVVRKCFEDARDGQFKTLVILAHCQRFTEGLPVAEKFICKILRQYDRLRIAKRRPVIAF